MEEIDENSDGGRGKREGERGKGTNEETITEDRKAGIRTECPKALAGKTFCSGR